MITNHSDAYSFKNNLCLMIVSLRNTHQNTKYTILSDKLFPEATAGSWFLSNYPALTVLAAI